MGESSVESNVRAQSCRTEVSGLDLVHSCVCVFLISYQIESKNHIMISGVSKNSKDVSAVGLHSYVETISWFHPLETKPMTSCSPLSPPRLFHLFMLPIWPLSMGV